jgi:guanosine-3',5'-bis(diphosphate) 3'-pyrophosphohydrolase
LTTAAEELLKELTETLRVRSPGVDLAFVTDVFEFTLEAHGEQRRESGEIYIAHCVETVKILSGLLENRLDTSLVAAALLHDVAEDTPWTTEQIRKRYGFYVAFLVDGVTKISGLRFDRPEKAQAENFRKMLLSMAKDMRVILIKLADRLHNMRTLDALDERRARQIALETKEVYAPLAHRLGIAKMKWELEDLSFKILNPRMYDEIKQKVALKLEERERVIAEAKKPLMDRLASIGLAAEVTGRPKHFDSIYRKMVEENLHFEDIYDLLGLRVITEEKNDCYRVLGIIHDIYTPVHDRFKDYIAVPKTNMYQSLHTTVVTAQGKMVEFQIRTWEMHRTAELGIAAHYSYKEGGSPDQELSDKLPGLLDTREWAGDSSSSEFMEFLRISLYQDEVFVFTPKGDLLRLPKGATPLDLAYAVHTEVGQHCSGAKANGRIVPLRYELKSGDTVEIITSAAAHPGQDWINVVKTSSARAKIRKWLKERQREDSVPLGREMLEKELRRRKIKAGEVDLEICARALGLADVEQLYAAVGSGSVSVRHAVGKMAPPEPRKAPDEGRPSPDSRERTTGIRIQGLTNLMIRFAKCCQPVPGDGITGLITRGRGVSVHASDCPNVLSDRIPPESRIEVEWDVGLDEKFTVGVMVYGEDRTSLLADIAQAISQTDTNIKTADVGAAHHAAAGVFRVEVRDVKHLQGVMRAIGKVKGVTKVERERPGDSKGE